MQSTKQEYIFSTIVSDSTDVNEFIIEFYPENAAEGSDELVEFLNELEN